MYRIEALPTDCDHLGRCIPLEGRSPYAVQDRVGRVHTYSIPSHLSVLLFFGHEPVSHLANGVRMKNKKAASRAQDHLDFPYTKKTHYCERDGSGSRRCSGVSEGGCHFTPQEFPVLQVIFCTIFLHCNVHIFNLATHEYSLSPWSEKGLWSRAGRTPARTSSIYCILSYIVQSTRLWLEHTIFTHQSSRLLYHMLFSYFFNTCTPVLQ
ncbi:hypothetical protein F5B22DRAFT_25896 [Xylaria bambusicola]|uniref:uncharacterized protein n=1 Tax=Xylaria bambusicola TaxID=326684 RepID=UPI0020085F92|nr:uncharacterized protein F5B22DRAFT_25896 [Xylaria bambusicola]KAI0528194.1 hypothetical protein F5B22DRAFT_25896 [Xylaria bambusicola]